MFAGFSGKEASNDSGSCVNTVLLLRAHGSLSLFAVCLCVCGWVGVINQAVHRTLFSDVTVGFGNYGERR